MRRSSLVGLVCALLLLATLGPAFGQQCPHNCLRSQRDANGCCPTGPPPIPMPAGWVTFSSPEGRFSIDMPAIPRQNQQTLQTAVGPISMFTFVHEYTGGARAYMISFNDYPPAVVARGNAQQMLDGARAGAVRNVNGTLISERRITLGRYPGRELQIRVPTQSALVQARLYLVGNRLYQTLALARENEPVTAENNYFLTSFRLAP